VLCVLDVVIGELGVGSGDAAPGNAAAERVELETVAKDVESTTGGAQDVGKGSLWMLCKLHKCMPCWWFLVQHGSILSMF